MPEAPVQDPQQLDDPYASLTAKPKSARLAKPATPEIDPYADLVQVPQSAPQLTGDVDLRVPAPAPLTGKNDPTYKGALAAAHSHGRFADGMIAPGNIDLKNRPRVKNADGSVSTVRSMSFNQDGKEILVPTITPDGKNLSSDEAIARFNATGEHLGQFKDAAAATTYAQRLHEAQASALAGKGDGTVPSITPPSDSPSSALIRSAYTPVVADATRDPRFTPKNPQARQLTGAGKLASDVFSAGASALEHPVETVTGAATAPLVAAGKAGLFLGQRANDVIGTDGRDPNAATPNEIAAASGVPTVTDHDAVLSAAQLAAMGFGPLAGRLAGKVTSSAVSAAVQKLGGVEALASAPDGIQRVAHTLIDMDPTLGTVLGNTVEHGTTGALIGASFDPEHPARGAIIGAGLGVAANEASAAEGRRLRRPGSSNVETDASRLIKGNTKAATAEARVVDEPASATHEPDFTIEPLDHGVPAEDPYAEVTKPSAAAQDAAPTLPDVEKALTSLRGEYEGATGDMAKGELSSRINMLEAQRRKILGEPEPEVATAAATRAKAKPSEGVPSTEPSADAQVPEAAKPEAVAVDKAADTPTDAKEQTTTTPPSVKSESDSFTTEKGSTYAVDPEGRTTRNKAARAEHPGDAGPQPVSQRTYYVDAAGLNALGEFQAEGAPGKRALVPLADGRIGLRYEDGPSAGKFEQRTVVSPHGAPAVGLYPIEVWNDGKEVHFGNKIVQVGPTPAPASSEVAAEKAPAQAEGAPPALSTDKDLFGKQAGKEGEQGALFGENAGKEAAKTLAHTEAAAHEEIAALTREHAAMIAKEAQSPTEVARAASINERLSHLKRLVNRDQKIGADELSNRAAAEPPTAKTEGADLELAPAADRPFVDHPHAVRTREKISALQKEIAGLDRTLGADPGAAFPNGPGSGDAAKRRLQARSIDASARAGTRHVEASRELKHLTTHADRFERGEVNEQGLERATFELQRHETRITDGERLLNRGTTRDGTPLTDVQRSNLTDSLTEAKARAKVLRKRVATAAPNKPTLLKDGTPVPAHLDTPEIRAAVARADAIPKTNLINTPERNAWRKKQADKMRRASTFERIAHLVLGHAGSGKTSILFHPLVREFGAAGLDSDVAKQTAPEYEGGIGATALNAESSDIRTAALKSAAADGANVVFPTVGEPKGTGALAKVLIQKGYTVHVHLIDVPPVVSAERVVQGWKDGTRHLVDPRSILDRGDSPRRAYAALADLPGVIAHVPLDNDVARGESPKPVTDWRTKWGLDNPASDTAPTGSSGPDDAGGLPAGRTDSEVDGRAGRPGRDRSLRRSASADSGSAQGVAKGEGSAAKRLVAPGKIVDEDGVARFEHARAPSGGRRSVAAVSTRGLLQELLDLEPKRADAENRAPYEVREDKSFATSGIPQIVSTKGKNGGPSMQAKAARNLADFQRITDEVYRELKARGMDNNAVHEATDELRAERDERAGISGDFDARNASRGVVTDASGKVLFNEPAPSEPKARATKGTPSAASKAGPESGEEKPAPPATVGAYQVNKYADEARKIFAPQTRTPEAGQMGRIVREQAATLAHELEHAREAMKTFSKSFDRMAPAERLAFIDRMEHGDVQPTPELTAAAKVIRDYLDKTRDEIRALGTGKLEHWIEDYFPHIWKDPEAAVSVIGRILGKRPLAGTKSFLKQRTIPTTKEGIAAGLEPVTDNPVDLALLKLREMRRYIMAQRIHAEGKANGLEKYVAAHEKAPNGYTAIDDSSAIVYGPPMVETSEAFDKGVRDGLTAAMDRLGVTHERKSKVGGKGIPRGALGYAKGADEIVSKFASHDGVIMHELGHILDARYGMQAMFARDLRTLPELHNLAEMRAANITDRTTSEAQRFLTYIQKPEEQMANALHAFLHAPEMMAKIAPHTKAILERFLASKSELKPILDIKPSLTLASEKGEVSAGGLVVRGRYYAPEAVATVLNRYLSPGLRGNAFYDAYQGVNNTLNQAQLGLSAFHLGFTSMDAAVSQAAVGLQNVSHGRVLKGLGQIGSYPIAPFTTFIRGSKVLNAYLHPDGQPSEMLQMIDAIIAGGGRVRQDSFYSNGAPKHFMEALRNGPSAVPTLVKPGSVDARVLGALRHALPALMELAAKPIMEGVVPRQKLGVFAQLAERAVADLPPNASRDEVRAAMGRAWDSVDNRLGQLVYDNLFWDKAMKDLSMAAVRSVGWNIGTFRELGGGAADLGKLGVAGMRRLGGKGPKAGNDPAELTERASYAAMLPIVVGLSGAIMTYLLTGEGPKELRDYYFPRTGKKNVEGNDERIQLPSYMKDVIAYKNHPVTTIGHKLAPALGMISDMLHNEDFFGDQIRNVDDPVVNQLQQEAEFLAKGTIPFAFRNAMEASQRDGDLRAEAGGFVGLTAAPRAATRTPAQNQAMEYLALKTPRGATPEQRDARAARAKLMNAAQQGTVSEKELDAAEEKGNLTGRQRKLIDRTVDGDANIWLDRFKKLSAEEALRVYKLGTAPEQELWRDTLEKKLEKAGMDDELDALPPPKPKLTARK